MAGCSAASNCRSCWVARALEGPQRGARGLGALPLSSVPDGKTTTWRVCQVARASRPNRARGQWGRNPMALKDERGSLDVVVVVVAWFPDTVMVAAQSARGSDLSVTLAC